MGPNTKAPIKMGMSPIVFKIRRGGNQRHMEYPDQDNGYCDKHCHNGEAAGCDLHGVRTPLIESKTPEKTCLSGVKELFNTSSSIQTVTVGTGVSPVLRALQPLADYTAGRESHPALKTSSFSCFPKFIIYAFLKNASPIGGNFWGELFSRGEAEGRKNKNIFNLAENGIHCYYDF
jgi:hypothetical protein